jgi:hypothetical protein
LIKFFLQELFRLLIETFISALGGGASGIVGDIAIPKGSNLAKALDMLSKHPTVQLLRIMRDFVFDGLGAGADILLSPATPPKKDGTPNPNDGAGVQIIQDIKITAENPATVINQMLDASLNRYGNTGRVV